MGHERAKWLMVGVLLATGACDGAPTEVDETDEATFLERRFAVEVDRDIIYATGTVRSPTVGEKDLLLDVYRPAGASAPARRPAFVLVHANFHTGSKTRPNEVGLAMSYAERGYVCISIDFRLVGDDPPTEHLAITPTDPMSVTAAAARVDAARAVEWMRAHADEYAVDPNRIVIGGHSAGAITSLGVAYRGPGEDGALVQAVVSMAGGLYGTESFIDAGDPPLILIHGVADATVPVARSDEVAARAQSVGLTYAFYRLEGIGHDIPPELVRVVDGITLENRIRDFLYEHLELEALADSLLRR
jgi:predicted esterase